MTAAPDDILDEQQAYYRARAPEYDDWWERRGRYDRGPEHTRAWNAEIDDVLVKRYWEPAELTDRLARLGWAIEAALTGRFFLVAHGAPT